MNIAHLIEQAARLFPDRPAFIFEETTISYTELDRRASKLAYVLQEMEIGKGDRVALFLPNIPAFGIAYYAIQKLGAIAVSINARATEAEVGFILEDCGAKMVFTTEAMRPNVSEGKLPNIKHIIITEGNAGQDLEMMETLLQNANSPLSAISVDRDDPAVILYTSGTTGMPKGATLSTGNVISNIWSFIHNCKITKEDRILLSLPLFHCFGQNALMNSGLAAGATLVLHRAFRPDAALTSIQEDAITMFFAVPTMFLALMDRATPEIMQTIRYYFSAAAKLPEEIERRWHEKFGRAIMQGYGLTETSPFASYNGFFQNRHGSIGVPIENVEMKIVDVTTGEDLPPETLGEIVIKGPNVMLGYWNRPAETAEVIQNGWFHSGDIGRMDGEGNFYIADRLKDMIDVGGMNVYPVEIENVLYRHNAVAEAAVYGVKDTLMGEQIWAKVILKKNEHVDRETLINFCIKHLANFKVPRFLEFVDELPKNPAGKILKRVLRDQASEQKFIPKTDAAETYYNALLGERRQVLQNFLATELSKTLELTIDQIDPDEPLTDLGLESLMAVDLSARLRILLGIEFSAMVLFGGSTLNKLTDILVAAMEEAQKQTDV